MTLLVPTAGPRHARAPLRGPARRVYPPRLADAAAASMATYAIPLLVLATTDSASLTGVAFVLAWVPRLSTFSVAGTVVDRFGPTRVFRLAAAARAAVVTLAAVALDTVADRWATVVVMVLATCTGALTQFSYVASESIGAAVSRGAVGGAHRVQSVLLGIDQSAALAGPAAGGFLLEGAGPSGMLAAIGALSLLAALITARVRHSPPGPAEPAARGIRTGWSTLRALPALAALVTGLALSNLALGVLQASMPVILVDELGHSSSDVGLLWSAAAAASLVAITLCRFAIGRWGSLLVGRLAAVVAVVSCFALARAGSYPAYLVFVAVFMAGDGVLAVVLRTLRARFIPEHVFGSTLSLTALILLLPYPLAGVLVATTPPASLGGVIGVCAVLQCVGLALAFVRIKRRPRRGKHRRALH
ncbi:MFS transporter [Streptomyces sp. NPDC059785]|uniref:MFS transporter n=1 Tax=unclassified Streptomyces TaxID=2593676 RepID=UPI00365FC7FF